MTAFQLLTIMIALAAYISAVRLALIGRIKNKNDESNKDSLKTVIRWLIPADAVLVTGSILLSGHLMAATLGKQPWPWLFVTATALFCAAVLILAVHHLFAWLGSRGSTPPPPTL
jgi:hypothetical protein